MNGIGDYGLIGDCHSLALVGMDGSIDWCCFPRFDSPSAFARVLDEDRGGHFRVGPAETIRGTERSYLPATNVLQTTFHTAEGRLEITDCMPVARFDPDRPAFVEARHSILRRIRVPAGSVSVRVVVEPRFEYGVVTPRFTLTSPTTMSIIGGPDALWVHATHPLGGDGDRVTATWDLHEGDEAWIEAAWTPAAGHDPLSGDPRRQMPARLADTVAFWQGWFACCSYDGAHTRKVHRSALVLKALTYAPTGAVIAAGTTALPEWIGGGRNWDYRFTWIRDATLTLASLVILGYLPEASAFKEWLERTAAGRPEDLQIMYRVTGERLLPEVTLDHLAGHRGSAPVRVGNGAAGQIQLDSYGQVLEAGYLFGQAGGELTPSNGSFLSRTAELAVRAWRHPDQGIWEIRDEPRHFVHSKLNCWVALDRAARMARAGALDAGSLSSWERERDLLADWLRSEGSPDGWFVQAGGRPVADAATLMVPMVGFAAPGDPTVTRTIEVVGRDLGEGGLIHRYLDPDGLAGPEGSFLLCSFWMVECLVAAGRLDEAEEQLAGLLDHSNDLGIFSEMVHPDTNEALGNTPQAFTHMAVVTSCEALTAARQGRLPTPDQPYCFAQAALHRRLSGGPTGSEGVVGK
ncbi:MAG: glycoside hydrolase family 15 protein [Acidimicrobiia bacterium]|nr:glycoside hydrolase family 15 protein [Acidimicrobiia bacterium]